MDTLGVFLITVAINFAMPEEYGFFRRCLVALLFIAGLALFVWARS